MTFFLSVNRRLTKVVEEKAWGEVEVDGWGWLPSDNWISHRQKLIDTVSFPHLHNSSNHRRKKKVTHVRSVMACCWLVLNWAVVSR